LQVTTTSLGQCQWRIHLTTSWALVFTGDVLLYVQRSMLLSSFLASFENSHFAFSFLMFAPFVAVADKFNKGAVLMVVQAAFLWALGPGMAAWITPNLQEQASIWCLFSIAQVRQHASKQPCLISLSSATFDSHRRSPFIADLRNGVRYLHFVQFGEGPFVFASQSCKEQSPLANHEFFSIIGLLHNKILNFFATARAIKNSRQYMTTYILAFNAHI
jgi:hypothetical protein